MGGWGRCGCHIGAWHGYWLVVSLDHRRSRIERHVGHFCYGLGAGIERRSQVGSLQNGRGLRRMPRVGWRVEGYIGASQLRGVLE